MLDTYIAKALNTLTVAAIMKFFCRDGNVVTRARS